MIQKNSPNSEERHFHVSYKGKLMKQCTELVNSSYHGLEWLEMMSCMCEGATVRLRTDHKVRRVILKNGFLTLTTGY